MLNSHPAGLEISGSTRLNLTKPPAIGRMMVQAKAYLISSLECSDNKNTNAATRAAFAHSID
jgi:hypothetical protein